MEYLESDQEVLAFCLYQDGSPDPWRIVEFLNSHRNKKVVFIDLEEFHPCFIPQPQYTLHAKFLNNVITKNNLQVEYWISLHSNRRHPLFRSYDIQVRNWPSFLIYLTHNMLDAGGKRYSVNPHVDIVTKLAICLNGKPRKHRCLLQDKIHARGLQDHMHLSWLVPDDKDYDFQYFDNKQRILDYDPGPSPDSGIVCVPDAMIPLHTQDALFALVAETSVEHQDISEKTFMYIEAKQPFVVFGAPGIHRILKRYYGFRLYEDHIDYGFDYVRDTGARADRILDQLQQYQGADYNALKQQMSDTAEYNYQLYMDIINSGGFIPDHIRNTNYISEISRHRDTVGPYAWLHNLLFA